MIASVEDRDYLRRQCERVGAQLYPRHPLGYRGGQSLVVFHHDVPNNTLPVLFEPGEYDGKRWTPLFPRPDTRH